MGDEHDGIASCVELVENIHDLNGGFGVQVSGGLVSQDQTGFGDDGPGNGHPLLLAAGKLCGQVTRPLLQVHPGQGRLHPFLPFGPGHLLVDQGQLHVFFRRELGNQVKALKNKADLPVPDPGKLVFRIVLNGGAVQQIGAGVGHIQAAHNVHQGGLTGAGGADDADKFTGGDVQVGLVQGIDPFAANLIDPGNILQINHISLPFRASPQAFRRRASRRAFPSGPCRTACRRPFRRPYRRPWGRSRRRW